MRSTVCNASPELTDDEFIKDPSLPENSTKISLKIGWKKGM